jgi:rhamnosyltransferase
MKIAGVVILYNADENIFLRINSYKDRIHKLYLIDNSDQHSDLLSNYASNQKNIEYSHDGLNKGISVRLNEAAKKAIEEEFLWLLTMDQDSYFDSTSLNHYINLIQNFIPQEEIAVFGVEYDERKVVREEKNFSFTSLLITSGSVVNLKVWDKLKGFNEKLFIDHVDHEYCFRVIANGYKTIKFNGILLKHTIGNNSLHRSFKSLKTTLRSLHSPIRLYYMIRNFFYLKKHYEEQFPGEIKILKKNLLIEIKNNLLYNKQRVLVLKYIIIGFIHFKKGKMGYYNII